MMQWNTGKEGYEEGLCIAQTCKVDLPCNIYQSSSTTSPGRLKLLQFNVSKAVSGRTGHHTSDTKADPVAPGIRGG